MEANTITEEILDVVQSLVADTTPMDSLGVASILLDIARRLHAQERETAVVAEGAAIRTLDQNRAMFGAWSELGQVLGHAREDDEQLARHLFASAILGRPVESWAHLSEREASVLIDRINMLVEAFEA